MSQGLMKKGTEPVQAETKDETVQAQTKERKNHQVKLTAAHILAAKQLAEPGTTVREEWTDMRQPGLRILVRRRSARWILRFGDRTVTLGELDDWSVEEARRAAPQIRAMLKSGLDPRPWIDARVAGASADEAAGVVLRRKAKERGAWTVETMLRTYLEENIRLGRLVGGERRAPSRATARDVEFVLNCQPFQAIGPLLAQELEEDDLERFWKGMAATHKGSASRKALAYVKAALSWARKYHPGASGLKGKPSWWRDVQSLHTEKRRKRRPKLEHVGLTLALAQAMHPAPAGRASSTALAFLVLVLFAQRRSMVAIEHRWVIEDERCDGWGILYIPDFGMKGRRDHMLPVPPEVMRLLRPAIAAAIRRGSKWLFPGARKGKQTTDIHMDGSALNQLLARLREDERERLGKRHDDKSVVTPFDWSPHDVRRTFATLIEDLLKRGDAVSAVLDHAAPRGDLASVYDAAEITRIAYSDAQRLPLKRLAIEPWVSMVLAAIEQARPQAAAIVAGAERTPKENSTAVAKLAA
jgi:integrase